MGDIDSFICIDRNQGEHFITNIYAVVEHDNVLRDYVESR